jgi:rfaE bifunctional protein nucleotidyltransferase chain/domain
MHKIVKREKLKKIIEDYKKRGKKVVFANGCFDLIHVGHVRFLKAAKSKGDVLVVGLNSDRSVHEIKGQGRPVIRQKERAAILSAFSFVDYVTIFNEKDVRKTLEILLPAYHAKGTDYTKETVPEKEISKKLGIKIVIVGDQKRHSTRDLIKTIRRKYK